MMQSENNSVIMYGGGGNSLPFLMGVTRCGVDVRCIVDKYTDKISVHGKPVLRIDGLTDKSVPIYISVGGISARIAEELKGLGYSNVNDFNASVRAFPSIVSNFLPAMPWYTHEHEKLVDQRAVDDLERELADEKSRFVLRGICDFRRHLDAEHYLENDGQLQYFPNDVPLFENIDELRFVDCGAFNGDTLSTLVEYCSENAISLRSAVLFEPERKNIEILTKTVDRYTCDTFDITVIPCGAWSNDTIVTLSEDSAGSTIVDKGQLKTAAYSSGSSLNSIAAVKLDHTVQGMRPNYIKMDIEGAERAALMGATNIIRKYRPILAICVYHKADDLWEIPSLINDIQPGYDFYLRSHGDVGLETVLYAVPK